jgi:hypothetical protein
VPRSIQPLMQNHVAPAQTREMLMKAQLDLNDIRTFVAVTQAGTLSGGRKRSGIADLDR